MQKKFVEFSILCSVSKVLVCTLLNKRVDTFTIVPYCEQIAKHYAFVILQSICGRIPYSAFRKVSSPSCHCSLLVNGKYLKPVKLQHCSFDSMYFHFWSQTVLPLQ